MITEKIFSAAELLSAASQPCCHHMFCYEQQQGYRQSRQNSAALLRRMLAKSAFERCCAVNRELLRERLISEEGGEKINVCRSLDAHTLESQAVERAAIPAWNFLNKKGFIKFEFPYKTLYLRNLLYFGDKRKVSKKLIFD